MMFYGPNEMEAISMGSGTAWALRIGGVTLFALAPGARVLGIGIIASTIPGSSSQSNTMAASSTAAAQAECENQCDLEWDRNKSTCDSTVGVSSGFNSRD